MLIFLKEKLVFFATPKTASTSIELALGTSCEMRISRHPNAKHTPYRKYKRLLEPFVLTLTGDEPDTVAVVREPIDWLGSWYRYRSRDELKGSKNSTDGISFNKFVEDYMSDETPDYASVGSQSKFMSDKDGVIGMSHLFRYDDMDGLVNFMQNRIKKQFTLGHANTSPKADLELSPALEKELHERMKQDFDIYEMMKKPSASF